MGDRVRTTVTVPVPPGFVIIRKTARVYLLWTALGLQGVYTTYNKANRALHRRAENTWINWVRLIE